MAHRDAPYGPIISILMVELVMMIANPLAALAVGFTLDLAFDWLVDQSPQCAKD